MSEPADGFQDLYLSILYISASEHLKLYNKAIFGQPETDRYDITRYKWTELYQILWYDVSTFGLKLAVFIVTSRYGRHSPTQVK